MSSLLWLRTVHASQSEASACVERSLRLCNVDFIGADVDVIDADVDVDVDVDVIDVDADVDVVVADIDVGIVEFRLLEVRTCRFLQGVFTSAMLMSLILMLMSLTLILMIFEIRIPKCSPLPTA